MSYCLHVVTEVPKGIGILPKQGSPTPEYQGVPLIEKRTLRDEPYWVAWLDNPRQLVKAHVADERACPPWGW